MSDSSIPEYILAKPVKVSVDSNSDWFTVEGWQGVSKGTFSFDEFDSQFVPLDRQGLTEQLEKITAKIYYLGVTSGRGEALWPEQESYIDDEIFNNEILALFGLENKEEK